jgi:preprotein translocase subunit YajC
MTFLETVAYAAEGAAAPADAIWQQVIFIGGFIAIFYFLLWRPQSKRRKEHQALMAGISKGDEVVTVGGIVGLVTKVEDDFIKVQVAPGTEFRVQKSAVGATLPKGTLKTLDEK